MTRKGEAMSIEGKGICRGIRPIYIPVCAGIVSKTGGIEEDIKSNISKRKHLPY